MPHPERAVRFTQLPHWTYLKERYARDGVPMPSEGPGLRIFRNAVNYFV
jgi:phosphoribosylformylglycinamidine synthase